MSANPPSPAASECLSIDAVIFDMDGLLLDTERLANAAWEAAALEQGFVLTHETQVACVGIDDFNTQRIIREALGPTVDMPLLARRRGEINDSRIDATGLPLRPGALAMVAWVVERGLPIAIATSSARERTTWKLARAGLTGRFSPVCTRDDVARGKPAPDIYLLAAQRLGVAPGRCLVFEDSDPGVRAAHAAGMSCVMVPDQRPPAPDTPALAIAVHPSLDAARAWLAPRLNA